MRKNQFSAILVAGPTASGKSSFALDLAKASNGVIINADSMQVYKDLEILTARPSKQDEEIVPHKLYGIIPAEEAYSAGRWATDLAGVLAEAKKKGRMPIIVGGTGLYFSVLLNGLSPIPDVPNDIRAKWRQRAEECDASELHENLKKHDPQMAECLRPSDTQRIVRALEVIEGTGQSLLEWQKIPGEPFFSFDQLCAFVVSPERDELYQRIDNRFHAMVENGAIEEVARLSQKKLDTSLPIMRALGVIPLIAYLRGDIELSQAIERSKTDTRRYAKRQLTWLRRNMVAWKWLSEQDMESYKGNPFAFIED